jgi:hypothetical protein
MVETTDIGKLRLISMLDFLIELKNWETCEFSVSRIVMVHSSFCNFCSNLKNTANSESLELRDSLNLFSLHLFY